MRVGYEGLVVALSLLNFGRGEKETTEGISKEREKGTRENLLIWSIVRTE